jgi:hypothetical protein
MCSLAKMPASAAELAPGHAVNIGLDLGIVGIEGYPSWTEGSVGKLRYADDGLVLNRAFLDYEGRITDTLGANLVLEAYNDEPGAAIDVTQAFLEWRPVPHTSTRYRVRLGAFYPRISLENVAAAWSSPYSISSSAINTWIAEELRTLGAEISVSRRPATLGGLHAFSFDIAAYRGDDPVGSLLAWKGWSIHDRQTRFGDELPLPPLPQIQPGMMFEKQDPYVDPFREIDGSTGFSTTGEWRYGDMWLLRLGAYDNCADPTVIENGQYAWHTTFAHVGLQTELPGDIGFIAQWMAGSTTMGPILYPNGAHAVDAEYASYFTLLTREFGRHRLSLRYDNFEITQRDQTFEDNNAENGHALTFAYLVGLSKHVGFAAEWLSIKTHRGSWAYYDLRPRETETQLQLSLRLRL